MSENIVENINLIIKTEDMYGMNESFVYKSEKAFGERGTIYKYKDEFGMTTIFIYSRKVRIVRKGQINSDMIMEQGQSNDFNYETREMKRIFTVKTEHLEVENNKIIIKYTVQDSDTVINEIKIVVKEGS